MRARSSVVLQVCVAMVFPAVLVTSLFFLTAGHNAPGGGFIGGLVAGSAFVLRYLVSSGDEASRSVRLPVHAVLGAGLLLAVGAAVVPWFLGGQLLESTYVYLPVPLVGSVPLTSVLVFDTGVFLIVVGVVLAVLSTLGSRTESSLAPQEGA